MRQIHKTTSILIVVGSIFASYNAYPVDVANKWSHLTKEDKLLYTNLGGVLAITVWGVANWDYGERSAHADSEGWFGANTKTGGADK